MDIIVKDQEDDISSIDERNIEVNVGMPSNLVLPSAIESDDDDGINHSLVADTTISINDANLVEKTIHGEATYDEADKDNAINTANRSMCSFFLFYFFIFTSFPFP